VATAAAAWLEKNLVQRKNKRTHLTLTGLLMEGVIATLRLLFARQAKGKRKLVLLRFLRQI